MVEVWKPALLPEGWPSDTPSRSTLFGVTPYGFDGLSHEHIVSFFRRASTAHALLPRTLAYQLVVPSLGHKTLVSADFMADACYRLDLCGFSANAIRWVEILNELTSRTDLESLTLSFLRGIVSPYQLIAQTDKFCPACYAEDEKAGRQKYDRLLWAIRCVAACPLHELRLTSEPRYQKQRPLNFTVPGISRISGTSLANVVTSPASEEEITIANLVAQFIDSSRYVENELSSSSDFLAQTAHQLFDGNSAALARYLGVAKSQIHGWMCEGVLPSLSAVVRIAFALTCSIANVITGNVSRLELRLEKPLSHGLYNLPKCSGYKIHREQLASSLSTYAKINPEANAKEAATYLGVSIKFLRSNFAEQNRQLVSAGRLRMARISEERRNVKDSAYYQAHIALKESGVYPSRRKIVQRLKEQGIRLTFADERRAMKEVKKTQKAKLRGALASASV
ncbi:transcriptional regulator with XRE-family HTH domain [Paraburkholderia sp. GAS333]